METKKYYFCKVMEMKKKYWAVVVMLLCSLFSLNAADKNDLTVLTFNHGDSVSLRWAPGSEALFQKSAQSGYFVQRRQKGETTWQTISPLLKPLDISKMAELEAVSPDAAVVKEILYPSADRYGDGGQPSDPNGPTLESIPGESRFEDDLLYMMALFSCDISLETAKAAALHYVDKRVDKNATYQYRVVFSEDEKKGNAKVNVADVVMSQKTVLPISKDLVGYFDETFSQLEWSVASHVGYYSAYNVERSLDGIHYTELRERPFVHSYSDEELADNAIFRDSFPIEEGEIYYRIKGYSPFGFYGPVSNVVKGEPKFNIEKLPLWVDTVIVGKKSEEIRWSFNKEYERKIKGFKISRTPDYKKFYYETTELISLKKRKFVTSQKYDKTQYYAVIAVGVKDTPEKRVEKQSSYYMSFRSDTIPPAVPTGLKAVIDSSGVVNITWNKNEELDIRGYQVFVSNSNRPDDYYTLTDTVYPLNSYTYQIPLNTLTNVIYYRVNAIDKSFNRSQWCDPVKLIKPDTLPPAPAVFYMLEQPKDRVVVSWDNSPSEDVSYMELYRQIDDTGKVVMIQRFDLTKKRKAESFEDPYEFRGEQVRYYMKVYDEVGNVSESRSPVLNAKGERPGCIGNLKVQVTNLEDEKNVKLTWDVISDVLIYRYVIYKKKDDGPMLDIASVRGNNCYYVDDRLAVGSTYKYIVRAISPDKTCKAVYSEPVEFTGTIK